MVGWWDGGVEGGSKHAVYLGRVDDQLSRSLGSGRSSMCGLRAGWQWNYREWSGTCMAICAATRASPCKCVVLCRDVQ